jgi:hypothetical protein
MDSWDKEQNLFDIYSEALVNVPGGSDPTDNPKDQELISLLRDSREKYLSPYAFKSRDSRGRRFRRNAVRYVPILSAIPAASYTRRPFAG